MTLYHGTAADLRPGDLLVPGDTIGRTNWPDAECGWGVWLTPDPATASRYGARVHEVEPVGAVIDWCAENGWEPTTDNAEFVADAARVVGVAPVQSGGPS